MSLKQHFEYLANYNQWMNAKVFETSLKLPPDEIHADKGAFFGSLFGTLNHLWRADVIWLKRFADHPAAFRSLEPVRLLAHPYDWTRPPYADLAALAAARASMDEVIVDLSREASEEDYAIPLRYAIRNGEAYTNVFSHLMLHFFNHHTHHRGQATTLLSQAGLDAGVTDLIVLFPEAD